MNAPLVQIDAMSYMQAGADAALFHDLSLQLETGACHVFLGRSGCGKSTLLRLIAGLLKPQQGNITINLSAKMAGGQQFLFQDYDSFPWLTVFDNVLKGSGPPPYPSRDAVDKILARVGLGHAKHLYPRALSGGMRKRLGFARCMVRWPRLLLLDEPFASLDIVLRLEMYNLLQELIQEHGTTVILVSHDLHEALLLGDHLYVLGGQPAQLIHQIHNQIPHPRTEKIVMSSFYAEAHAALINAIHATF